MDYHRGSHSKYPLKARVILAREYRRKPLSGLGGEVKEPRFQRSRTKNSGFSIDAMETDQDHIHLLVDFKPAASVKEIVRKLKSYTTVFPWKEYGAYLKTKFWKERTFWSDGYFACATGAASAETIRKRVETRG
ncbi:MAG: IS200/IS605 family transposase [Deltaproteobacteria bacterium]|jgi:putative transposase|nr:IS200/IS605 family transposase [Deltaproteobacteria bacterium]